MKSRRELAEEQLALMNDIRAKANINIVTCGYCGTVLLHSMLDDSIVCYSNKCKDRGEMNLSDCPDLWYDGCIENMIFDDEPIKEESMEESNLIWDEGTIIEWNDTILNYSAKGGARARVVKPYTKQCEMVVVEFLDDLSNGQENGGYYSYLFKDEPIKETPPTSQCGNTHTFNKVKQVIQILKTLDNGDCVDGETMQYILGQVGMEEQMLKQLVMENDYKVTKDLMREKFELDL